MIEFPVGITESLYDSGMQGKAMKQEILVTDLWRGGWV